MIDTIEAGTTQSLPQDLALATKARRLRKTDGAIDWSRSAAEIKNQVRALQPWPRAYTDWLRMSAEPLRLIMGQVDVCDSPREAVSGEVLVAEKDELVIATGQQAVAIRQLQPAGRQMMSAAEFLAAIRFVQETDSDQRQNRRHSNKAMD